MSDFLNKVFRLIRSSIPSWLRSSTDEVEEATKEVQKANDNLKQKNKQLNQAKIALAKAIQQHSTDGKLDIKTIQQRSQELQKASEEVVEAAHQIAQQSENVQKQTVKMQQQTKEFQKQQESATKRLQQHLIARKADLQSGAISNSTVVDSAEKYQQQKKKQQQRARQLDALRATESQQQRRARVSGSVKGQVYTPSVGFDQLRAKLASRRNAIDPAM